MIKVDFGFCLGEEDGFISETEMKRVIDELEMVNERVKKRPYPFVQLALNPYEYEEMVNIKESLSTEDLEDLLILGIGGSSLGCEAIFQALLPERTNFKGQPRYWIFDNIDPKTVSTFIERVNLEKSIVVVVSKSGETFETLSQFLLIKRLLSGIPDWRERVVLITDKDRGPLRMIAQKEGLKSLSVPKDVGGRFSVLSPVGLFPSMIMGISAHAILSGARRMVEHIFQREPRENLAILIASVLYLMERKGKRNHVIMPYCDRLIAFGNWFRQLEAESLGKDGLGPTPLLARGVTDQHSQLQLFLEGPKDKFVIFLYVPSPGLDIPHEFEEVDGLSHLRGKNFETLFHAEYMGTRLALEDSKVPYLEIELSRIDEETLGALFILFEVSIAYFGEILGVNPFDQPGVEKGKIYTRALMGEEGLVDLKGRMALLESRRLIKSL